MMECLVGPLRTGNHRLEDKFKRWFHGISVLPVTNIVFTEAAILRANNPNLKTPDAIHLASAIQNGCDEFWTNDERLSTLGLNIIRNISSI
ncbi:MAG: type II toxin-antitoxin system VapC family toxin [Acidobacteriota bacterium]|nr:MAG: type II toxin-antitoxin system VapC family toxin [Acidobacteriota bacterium]